MSTDYTTYEVVKERGFYVAKNGEFIDRDNNKSILLEDGKIITTSENNQNIIDELIQLVQNVTLIIFLNKLITLMIWFEHYFE